MSVDDLSANRAADLDPGPLVAVESDCAWYVCWRESFDWIARFEKADGFDARAWAVTMINTYNRRRRTAV